MQSPPLLQLHSASLTEPEARKPRVFDPDRVGEASLTMVDINNRAQDEATAAEQSPREAGKSFP